MTPAQANNEAQKLLHLCNFILAVEIIGVAAVALSLYAAWSGGVLPALGLTVAAVALTWWCDRKNKEVRARIDVLEKWIDEYGKEDA